MGASLVSKPSSRGSSLCSTPSTPAASSRRITCPNHPRPPPPALRPRRAPRVSRRTCAKKDWGEWARGLVGKGAGGRGGWWARGLAGMRAVQAGTAG